MNWEFIHIITVLFDLLVPIQTTIMIQCPQNLPLDEENPNTHKSTMLHMLSCFREILPIHLSRIKACYKGHKSHMGLLLHSTGPFCAKCRPVENKRWRSVGPRAISATWGIDGGDREISAFCATENGWGCAKRAQELWILHSRLGHLEVVAMPWRFWWMRNTNFIHCDGFLVMDVVRAPKWWMLGQSNRELI